MNHKSERLEILRFSIPLTWKRNIFYLLSGAIPCLFLYLYAGRYFPILQEGILWIPFFGTYLFLRYRFNKKRFPEPLFIIIDDNSISIPKLPETTDQSKIIRFSDIKSVEFYHTITGKGNAIMTYCNILVKDCKTIRLPSMLLDLKKFRECMSGKHVSVFSRKDTSLKDYSMLFSFLILIFMIFFFFFIIPNELRKSLYDYVKSLKFFEDYFGF